MNTIKTIIEKNIPCLVGYTNITIGRNLEHSKKEYFITIHEKHLKEFNLKGFIQEAFFLLYSKILNKEETTYFKNNLQLFKEKINNKYGKAWDCNALDEFYFSSCENSLLKITNNKNVTNKTVTNIKTEIKGIKNKVIEKYLHVIIEECASYHNVSQEDVVNENTRRKEIMKVRDDVRYIAHFLLCKEDAYFGKCLSLKAIGSITGGRTHASVINSINKVKGFIESYEKDQQRIRLITENCIDRIHKFKINKNV